MRHQQEVNEKKTHLSIKKMILHSPSKLACVRVDPLTISPLAQNQPRAEAFDSGFAHVNKNPVKPLMDSFLSPRN